ncbi:hypothetical protein G7K_0592-t1 [Saitoella complicata NRRL Y-17804]|uniref:SCP domain-containing protein n=2 Tax=Saitoella complicata (strain BCRC 22490 / CBS 7301 / JCM 7358 / NBRC 10748 / NRRL Y-17804) TaxID=698492 RepID=A0A0E9N9H9_SAICN|nr:hypothetical protein G7K_0592-t1 [Saitoella complicata NRRL Y-17804]
MKFNFSTLLAGLALSGAVSAKPLQKKRDIVWELDVTTTTTYVTAPTATSTVVVTDIEPVTTTTATIGEGSLTAYYTTTLGVPASSTPAVGQPVVIVSIGPVEVTVENQVYAVVAAGGSSTQVAYTTATPTTVTSLVTVQDGTTLAPATPTITNVVTAAPSASAVSLAADQVEETVVIPEGTLTIGSDTVTYPAQTVYVAVSALPVYTTYQYAAEVTTIINDEVTVQTTTLAGVTTTLPAPTTATSTVAASSSANNGGAVLATGTATSASSSSSSAVESSSSVALGSPLSRAASTTSTAAAATTTSSSSSTTPVTTSSTVSSSRTTTTTAASSSSSTTTSSAASATTTSSFIDSMLSWHNQYRAIHSAGAVTWNTTLATYAQNLADTCNFAHSGGPYGENLGIGTYNNPAYYVYLWYNEETQYDYSNPGFSESTGHFTQVVWDSTTEIGCGFATDCTTAAYPYYLVCEYAPPGNVEGAYRANVFPPSQTTSTPIPAQTIA